HAFLQKLMAPFCKPGRRPSSPGQPRTRPEVESLEERQALSAASPLWQAFDGLTVAVRHFVPPNPVLPPLSRSPVFNLNLVEFPRAKSGVALRDGDAGGGRGGPGGPRALRPPLRPGGARLPGGPLAACGRAGRPGRRGAGSLPGVLPRGGALGAPGPPSGGAA